MSSRVAAASKHNVDIPAIQKALQEADIDGWLFYYFHENDPLSLSILGLGGNHFTRRWFYFIPQKGEPIKLVHRIEMDALDRLAGNKLVYLGWRQLDEKLQELLRQAKKVAMQYSPLNAVPYISRVDGGLLELVKSCDVEVVSSGDLIQQFESVWSDEQLSSHVEAAESLRKIVFEAFEEVRNRISNKKKLTEYELQQFILQRFDHYDLTTANPPIVAVNEHSGRPHYTPTIEVHAEIKADDFLLLDIWAKKKTPATAVYADITWTGYVGKMVPKKYTEIFEIVSGARDAALNYVTQAQREKTKIHGWQVDDVARKFIADKGFGDYFVHRTGHSIGVEVHGNGANIDNLETRDERSLIPKTGFSIEPGIYLKEFGVRSEIDVYFADDIVMVAGGPIQKEIIPILR